MSYFSNVGFKVPLGDAFSRLRVSNPFTLLDFMAIADNRPLLFDEDSTGAGAGSTYNTDQASVTLDVTAATAGTIVRQSKERGYYRPGKSMLVLATGVLGAPAAGITRRIGYFDSRNGLFFGTVDGDVVLGRRSYTSGAAVDTVFTSGNWNIDPMDGTGPSGITLDPEKANIYGFDFEWLGVGKVRFYVNINGVFYLVHELNHANDVTMVYMGVPHLPIRYEIENDGAGGDAELVCICAAIMTEGSGPSVGITTYISRDGTPITLANEDLYTPIIGVRLKASHYMAFVQPTAVDVFLTTTTNYEWKLFLNPTVDGVDAVSWSDIGNSALQYDVSRTNANTLTGGYVLAGGYGASSNQVKQAVQEAISSQFALGNFIDGTPDELVLGVANVDGNGGTAYGGIALTEYI